MGVLPIILISVALCLFPDGVLTVEVQLVTLNNRPRGSMHQYQARCSIPCTGSYQPGDIQITLTFGKAVYNLYTFGHFQTDQESPRRVWEVVSTTWLHANSRGLCEFDVQVDHTPGIPVPTGTCMIGWDEPPCEDKPGVIVRGLTCEDIRYNHLYACYNDTVFDQCCYSCTKFRMDLTNCEYGDRSDTGCNISDHQCYNPNVNTRCCMTCSEIGQERQGLYNIPDCPYGNRLPDSNCTGIDRQDCYTMEKQCCDTCHWLADDTHSECKYGARGQCDSLLFRDCYNATIARECCDICNELKSEEHPDCLYGDRQQMCSNIDRKDCYQANTSYQCCSTCRELANPEFTGCEYGDKGDCDGVTASNCSRSSGLQEKCCEKCKFFTDNGCSDEDGDECRFGVFSYNECYDDNKRRNCCNFCYDWYDGSMAASQRDCSFGDRNDECWYSTRSEDCYDKRVERKCCDTCATYYRADLEENCKFGDRTPDNCLSISGIECYDAGIARDCCDQCSYWEVADNPQSCKYGDRSEECYRIAAFDCYDPGTERDCCETCPNSNEEQNYGYECRYGDRNADCYMSPYRKCYETGFRDECCKYCNTTASNTNPDCLYGDQSSRCDTLAAGECYDWENTCCQTCPNQVLHIVIDDCKYGDRRNCSDIQASDCYNATISRECCLTCYYKQGTSPQYDCTFGDKAADCSTIRPRDCYTRQNDCCNTCKNYVIQDHEHIDDCDYGDRAPYCDNIEDHQCYNDYTQRECCQTCYYRRNLNTTAADCLYGDRVTVCSDDRHHSSECYNLTSRTACCETCGQLRSNIANCVYGDKKVVCETITLQTSRKCYQLESDCCQSCPQYRNDNYPGCEYGDAIPDCYESECARYSAFDLLRCCFTCSNYVTPDVTGYTSSSTFTSTTSSYTSTPRYTSTPGTTSVTSDPEKQSGKTPTSTLKPDVTRFPQSSETPTRRPDTQTTTVVMETEKSASKKILAYLASVGPIVGGAVGGVIVLAIIIGVACFLCRRKANAEKSISRSHHLQQPPFTSAASYSNNHARQPEKTHTRQPERPFVVNETRTQPGGDKAERPTITRQNTKEEVYDYIHPDDVKSVMSEPAFRPALPERDLPDQAYLEPRNSVATNYSNRGFQKDSTEKLNGDNHHYHVLQKGDDANAHYYGHM